MSDSLHARAAVGILGVGRMALPIAAALVEAGHSVTGYRRGPLDEFVALGGKAQPSGEAVAEQSDILLVLVPDERAMLDLLANVAPSLRGGATVICLATHPVRAKQAAADIVARAGAVFLDGEISGTPDMVRSRTASVMIGGARADFDRVRPVLGSFSDTIQFVGPVGNAVKLKLVTNLLVAVHSFAAAEALQCAARLGLDPVEALGWLNASPAMSRMLEVRGPIMAERRFVPGNGPAFLNYFTLLREALDDNRSSPGPMLELTETWFRRSVELGFAERGIAGIHESLDDVLRSHPSRE